MQMCKPPIRFLIEKYPLVIDLHGKVNSIPLWEWEDGSNIYQKASGTFKISGVFE